MSPKHFFPESVRGTSNLTSPAGGDYITVTPNRPPDLDSQEVFIGISMDYSSADKGEAWAAVDASELRDAIDNAVGPREGAKGSDAKPYRPIDRDRLLRHIEDVEAALTRRNERHEQDLGRIRELEGLLAVAEAKTPREYLQLAWDAAIIPEDDMIREDEEHLIRYKGGRIAHSGPFGLDLVARRDEVLERRLLEPRTEKDERQALIDEYGLEDWELELLAGGAS